MSKALFFSSSLTPRVLDIGSGGTCIVTGKENISSSLESERSCELNGFICISASHVRPPVLDYLSIVKACCLGVRTWILPKRSSSRPTSMGPSVPMFALQLCASFANL